MAILCILPNSEMAKAFRKISESSEGKIIVEQGLLSEAIPIAKKYEDETDVIISRGGTVLVMRQAGIKAPIVELQVTAKDLALALEKAKALIKRDDFRIGVITFANMTQQLKDFLPFFKLNISLYELSIDTSLQEAIHIAQNDGMDILMGGVITEQVAEKCNVPAVLIESGETSIRYALAEAGKIAAARRLKDRRAEELRIITENISEGILATDASGNIFRMNKVARQFLRGLSGLDETGVSSRLPRELSDIIGYGKETRRVISLGQKRVMVDSIPVKVEGSVASSVITLQEVSNIQEMEEEIRREMHFKGYIAKSRFENIVAEDALTLRVIELAKRFARTNASILIRGESGVGKEIFAQSIHSESDRSARAFVAMNCAAIPDSLFESEMFGYVDGAFTDARKKGKPGLFEIAHRGTVFLDEISEMPLPLQARLLRVLQEHEIMRLGDDKIIPVDVRIIAASNRDLPTLVRKGLFRNDLYWRLNVLNLMIPPLRERKADIVPLATHFLADSDLCGQTITLPEPSRSLLRVHPWPGNVRELKNFCERVAAICDSGELDARLVASLLDSDEAYERMAEPSAPARNPAFSKEELLRVLEASGSVREAAIRLGIHRTTLWRHLSALGIDRKKILRA
ncbi:MAG: sigma 54-interacting transcriptional regulator [Rectinemataceae bacterium]|nr:sigma 54-interacting transcriptional regulator [Rectinemataceae bacterium]